MLQTSMKREQANFSGKSGQWATKRRNRKATAINNRRVSTESEEDRTRSHGDGEDGSRSHGDGEDGEQGGSKYNLASTGTLISFEKVLSRGSIHTAECCRLSLPRAFCERYDVGGDVTATDSAGTRVWHMRFQSCGAWKPSRPPAYTISNGWREFSYDHGLKARDRVVFTLLSTSHFRVEFVASSRRMIVTRDGEDYPWRLSYARLDCLSKIEKVIRIKNGVPVTSEDEEEIRPSSAALIALREDEHGAEDCVTPITSHEDEEIRRSSVAPITLQEDEQGVIRIRVKDEDAREVIVENMAEKLMRKNGMANHQQLQKTEMFCQYDMAMTRKGAVKFEYVVPELTHLECKNADGSSYLQIVDSDSEIA